MMKNTNTEAVAAARFGGGGGGGRAAPPSASASSSSSSLEDAMGFIRTVKEAFKDRHPERYDQFLRLMADFRSQRIGIAEVVSSAAELFRDAPALALGFNVFLPEGHQIPVDLDDLAAYLVRDMTLDGDNNDEH